MSYFPWRTMVAYNQMSKFFGLLFIILQFFSNFLQLCGFGFMVLTQIVTCVSFEALVDIFNFQTEPPDIVKRWLSLPWCVCVCSRCMISMLCSVCTFFQIYNSIIIYNPRIFVNKDYYTYIYIYILPQSVFTHMDMPVKLQNNTSKNT